MMTGKLCGSMRAGARSRPAESYDGGIIMQYTAANNLGLQLPFIDMHNGASTLDTPTICTLCLASMRLFVTPGPGR